MCIINNDFLYFGRKLSDLLFIFAADMKLQELLRKCDFDKMFEYIVKFDSKSEGSRFAYLVAYELLCDMEAEEGREYDVVPNPYAKESEGPASEITVWCSDLEGCYWQKAFTMLLVGIFPSKAEQQDGVAMLLVPSQNCCNRNCLG